MKMVTAIIRPERLQDVKTGLFREGITGMSLSTVLGHGGEQDTVEQYRGSAVVFEFVEKVKIEIAVPNHLVDKTIDTILKSAQTGTVGDGKIFVQSIERVVRIRTGDEDNLALLPIPLTVQDVACGQGLSGGMMQISAGDTAWMLTSAALVFLMSPGLAFFYAGLVRRKNALNTLMMTCVAISTGALIWMLLGYSLAFAPGNALLGGLTFALFNNVGTTPIAYASTIPALVFALFQGMFASITPAIISGAIVERMKFTAYLLYLSLWSLVVYAPVAHWVWGDGGWIRNLGALDFAGGTVVHVTAGIAALVCAWLLGARHDHRRAALVPHNVPFVLLGSGLLWFGWFGFNAGSALAANGVAALAAINTNTAAAAAMLTWLVLESMRSGKPTAVGAATGTVVGLVGITPAAGFVYPWAALIIGVVTAMVSFSVLQLRSKTALDDTLDVFACHGVGGMCGALLTGVFAAKAVNAAGADGLLYGNPSLLGVQALAVSATVIYTAVLSAVLVAFVRLVMPIRAGLKEELEGLDRHAHGEEAYHDTSAIGSLGGAVLVRLDGVKPTAERMIGR